MALAADLKAQEALDATLDAGVVRLDDAGSSNFVHELDETRVDDRAHELVIHRVTT